ncbi:MAG: DUF6390 family protein [bacterium]
MSSSAATSMLATPGQARFARYAYPPNELGYCGPDGAETLLGVAAGGEHESAGSTPTRRDDVDRRARAFDGAWVYLELIAASCGIADPLDERVVEAYWLGNDLLERVDPRVFAATVRTAFAAQTGADWRLLAAREPCAVPHHSFQVFSVYPWVGLLGRGDTARHVLDRCRIRNGLVESLSGEEMEVRSRLLTWDGRRLGLGEPVSEVVRWSAAGQALSGPRRPDPGDVVALHWEWVCERLTPEQVDGLDRYTARQLDLTNAALAG